MRMSLRKKKEDPGDGGQVAQAPDIEQVQGDKRREDATNNWNFVARTK